MKINEIQNRKTVEKRGKIQNWFYEKINKIDKLSARETNKKRERSNTINPQDLFNIYRTLYPTIVEYTFFQLLMEHKPILTIF